MARIPAPNQHQAFDHYYYKYGQNEQGEVVQVPEYGIRQVDGHEEIVHLESGQSNMNYYQADIVHPENCNHLFIITDIGKREIECRYCSYATVFHAKNIEETPEGVTVILHNRTFAIDQN